MKNLLLTLAALLVGCATEHNTNLPSPSPEDGVKRLEVRTPEGEVLGSLWGSRYAVLTGTVRYRVDTTYVGGSVKRVYESDTLAIYEVTNTK